MMKERLGIHMKDKIISISFILMIIYIIILSNTNSELKSKYNNKVTNEQAMLYEMNNIKAKNGDVITQNMAFSKTVKELQKSNDSIYNELKKFKGKPPEVIVKQKIIYQVDSIFIESNNVEYREDERVEIPFKYDNNGLSFSARTSMTLSDNIITEPTLLVENINMKMNLTTAIKEEKNQKLIMVTSDNPYIKIDTIYGNIIPSKVSIKDRVGLGLSIGPTISATIYNGEIKPSVGIGMGVGLVYIKKK